MLTNQHHFGIVTDCLPDWGSGQLRSQDRGRPAVGRFGVGPIAHFYQPGQVLARGKAGIHPRFDMGRWIGVGLVVGCELCLPGTQLGQLDFLFAQASLMLGQNPLSQCDLFGQPGLALVPTRHLFLQKGQFPRRNWPLLDLLGVVAFANQSRLGLVQLIEIRLVLSDQSARAVHHSLLGFKPLGDQLRSAARSQPGLRLGSPEQFLQAGGRNGIARMMKAGQPQPFVRTWRKADPRQLITQSDLIIHAQRTESGVGISGAGGADRLTGQVKIINEWLTTSQQFMHGRFDEGAAEGRDGRFNRGHGLIVSHRQRSAHTAVVGKALQPPRLRHTPIAHQRVRPGIQILQMLDPAHDPSQELNHLSLRSVHARLLADRHLPQPLQQTMLLQKFSKCDQHSTPAPPPGAGVPCYGSAKPATSCSQVLPPPARLLPTGPDVQNCIRFNDLRPGCAKPTLALRPGMYAVKAAVARPHTCPTHQVLGPRLFPPDLAYARSGKGAFPPHLPAGDGRGEGERPILKFAHRGQGVALHIQVRRPHSFSVHNACRNSPR